MWKININLFGPAQAPEDPRAAEQARYEAERAQRSGELGVKRQERAAECAKQGRHNNTSTNWVALTGRGNGPEAPGTQQPQPDPNVGGGEVQIVETANRV